MAGWVVVRRVLVCNRLGAAVNTETRGSNTSTHQHISTQATHKNSIYTFYTDHEYYDGLGSIGRTKHFLMNVIQILKSSPMEMVLTLVTIFMCLNVNKSQVFSFRYWGRRARIISLSSRVAGRGTRSGQIVTFYTFQCLTSVGLHMFSCLHINLSKMLSLTPRGNINYLWTTILLKQDFSILQ